MVTALLIGFVVYSAGIIGFVGLIIPHVVRMFFGTDHKKMLPLSALSGSIFLIWADVASRIIIPKSEVPIGILVSMIGAPCFIYLLVRRSYGFGGEKSMKLTASDIHVELGGNEILKGIDAAIKEKEFVGIIGPNGSGKKYIAEMYLTVYLSQIPA